MKPQLAAFALLVACGSATELRDVERYALVRYEGADVPSADFDGERIVSGYVDLGRGGAFVDVLVRQAGALVVRDSFSGTWEIRGDSLHFEAPEYRMAYAASLGFGEFTLWWADGAGIARTFTYKK